MSDGAMMRSEAGQSADVAARQVQANGDVIGAAAARLRALNAPFAATLARGSSDQAASFAKVLFETRLHLPTLTQAPSTGTLYGPTSPKFAGVPLIAISQSGRSPDLVDAAISARAAGAVVVALVNDQESPLYASADIPLPLAAGVERSVAATKTFVASLAAIAHLTAVWGGDRDLLDAVERIGETLEAAWRLDWSEAVEPLLDAESLLVLGRGLTLPIAGEAALKFKETSGLHAEAFSTAEVAHGPMTLVGASDPVFVFGPRDAARAGLAKRIESFTSRGACVIAAGAPEDIGSATIRLPTLEGVHPVTGAISMILPFYRFAVDLALARGRDPDQPPHLAKVTRTT